MRLIKFVLLLTALQCYIHTFAQVATKFNNNERLDTGGKFLKHFDRGIDMVLPAKNINVLLNREANATTEGEKKLMIADPTNIDIDFTKKIKWITNNGFAYGKFKIKISGALTSSINFDKFFLPTGTEMYIYNEGGEMITEPATELENNNSMKWGSWVYNGDELNIEIKIPVEVKNQLILHSSNVAYGYKKCMRKFQGLTNQGHAILMYCAL